MLEDRWYSEKELEEHGIAKSSTLRTWRWLGRGIPFQRFGRSIRYRGKDVLEYAKKNRVEPIKR